MKIVRKPRRRGETSLTEDQLHYLLSGNCLDGIVGVDSWEIPGGHGAKMPFRSMADYESAWKQNKSAILRLVGQEEGFPWGSRPDAWWRFEAPEERPEIPWPVVTQADMIPGYTGYRKYSEYRADVRQADLAYLKRIDILLPGELEAIAERDLD